MELDPWGPVLGVLFEDQSSDYILGILQRAGVPTGFDLTEEEAYSHTTRKRAYKRRLEPVYAGLEPAAKLRVTQNLACEVTKSKIGLERLNAALERIGWTFENGQLTPLSPGGKEIFPKASELGRTQPDLPSSKEKVLAEIEDIIKTMPDRATIRHPTQENAAWFGRARPWIFAFFGRYA